jgi:nicotinamidase-related amidase
MSPRRDGVILASLEKEQYNSQEAWLDSGHGKFAVGPYLFLPANAGVVRPSGHGALGRCQLSARGEPRRDLRGERPEDCFIGHEKKPGLSPKEQPMKMKTELPLPAFFQPTQAESWVYAPQQAQLFEQAVAWSKVHGVKDSGADTVQRHLLLIDVQKDFCLPQGSLYVGGRSGRGAVDDSLRLASFIYRNLPWLTDITTTMDTHFAYQIFFPSFWVDRDGSSAWPYREITSEQIHRGEVKPNPALAQWLCNGDYSWLLKQASHYCEELERAGKYKLYLWPPHCLLGSDGHALVGILHEARLFHSFARGAQSWVEVKGGNPLTENYSVLQPEVLQRFDGQPLAQRNTQFIKTLLNSDAVIIAGQASSHCVKSTIDDLLAEIVAQDPELAQKVYLLTDCMSAVAIPDGKGAFLADFTPQAEQALARFADAGMHLVQSTTTLADWPDLVSG